MSYKTENYDLTGEFMFRYEYSQFFNNCHMCTYFLNLHFHWKIGFMYNRLHLKNGLLPNFRPRTQGVYSKNVYISNLFNSDS